MAIRGTVSQPNNQSFKAIGINDFLNIDIPAREMLLSPILPERSLAMLYAPRGVGRSWLGLSIGLVVAAGESLLRWSAPRQRNVLYVDGEMPLVSLQERLKEILAGFGRDIPNDGFRIPAADNVEGGIILSTEERKQAIEHLLEDIDLVILDNLSALLTSRSETASDAWVPMQQWLLRLRREGISVLLRETAWHIEKSWAR
jgi:putative DNA primase/helicase